MKKLLFASFLYLLATSCGDGNETKTETSEPSTTVESASSSGNPSYDPKRGEGKFKDVVVASTLDATKASNGEKTFGVKCGSCHKLTDEKLVGPGWKGVTARHEASWILNFMTNTDEMLNKDPKEQAQLEICLVRMPNQNLSDDEALSLYEFMRKNDGVK